MRLKILFLILVFLLQSCEKKPSELVLSFVGDVMFDRNISRITDTGVRPFEKVQFLLNGDFKFANLETTVATNGHLIPKAFNFMSSPDSLAYLTNAGFNVVSIANNHTMDYDVMAFLQTVSNLTVYGIQYTGAGLNLFNAVKPVILETNGICVGLLAFGSIWPLYLHARTNRAGIAPVSISLMTQAVCLLKPKVDFVVVSLHWGWEYEDIPKAYQLRVAHALIDSGANLIFGHHPHNLQGVESYHNGMIFYSLGNFIFDQRYRLKTRYTMIGELHLKKDHKGIIVAEYVVHPLMKRFDTFMPDVMNNASYRDWAFRMVQLQQPFSGFHCKADFQSGFTDFIFEYENPKESGQESNL